VSFLGGWAFSCERGTTVGVPRAPTDLRGCGLRVQGARRRALGLGERASIELMTSDHQLMKSREGSK